MVVVQIVFSFWEEISADRLFLH